MSSDPSIRVLLALILVCLIVLIAQGFRVGSGATDEGGRYRVSVIRSAKPWLMRVDTWTGEVEQFKVKGAREWVTLGESDEDVEGDDAGPAAKAAPPPPAVETPAQAATPEPAPAAPAPPAARTPVDAASELDALAAALTPANPPDVRAWAAEQLVALGGDDAVAALRRALEGQDAELAESVIGVLQESGSDAATAAIRGLAEESEDPAVQEAAQRALEAP